MRALKFIGVFLGVLIIIVIISFGLKWNAVKTLFNNREGIKEGSEWVAKTGTMEGLAGYISAQPKRVSVVSIEVGKPDSSIFYNAHAPRTMGKLQNLFFVIEYARQVQNGSLNADEPIQLEQINRFQLTNVNQSNHENMLNWLEANNKISDENYVPLHTLVQASVIFNDVALSDFLLFKLGIENIKALMDKLNLQETELPLPFSGLYITINPPAGRDVDAYFDSLSFIPRAEFQQLILKTGKKFVADKTFHQKEVKRFKDGHGLSLKFTKQRDALVFFPKTTAAEMSSLMKNLAEDKLLSPQISKRVKQFLKWPLKVNEAMSRFLNSYGAIYDMRMGMANGASLGRSASTDELYAQAVFFDNLQVGFWFHISSNLMTQDFQQQLIWNTSLQKTTLEATRGETESTATQITDGQ
ncbi:MAG TPA: serine hydrolase [Balneolaceae bacterium]|nr:serine hydrolase [Balneolaceae bacterium]